MGLLGGPGAFDADPVHDLDEVEEAGARQVVGGGQQLQVGHRDAAGAGEAGQAVGQGRLALAGGDDDDRAAAGAGVDQLLRRWAPPRSTAYARLAQIRQLRVVGVGAQHRVGGVQGLPGGPGQQAGRDAVAGGEQDDAAGGGVGSVVAFTPRT